MLVTDHDAAQMWRDSFIEYDGELWYFAAVNGRYATLINALTNQIIKVKPDTDMIRPFPHRGYGYVTVGDRGAQYVSKNQQRQFSAGFRAAVYGLPNRDGAELNIAVWRMWANQYPTFKEAKALAARGLRRMPVAFHRDFAFVDDGRGGYIMFRDQHIINIREDSIKFVRKEYKVIGPYFKEVSEK